MANSRHNKSNQDNGTSELQKSLLKNTLPFVSSEQSKPYLSHAVLRAIDELSRQGLISLLSHQAAEAFLKKQGNENIFLIRKSQTANDIVASFWKDKNIVHVRVGWKTLCNVRLVEYDRISLSQNELFVLENCVFSSTQKASANMQPYRTLVQQEEKGEGSDCRISDATMDAIKNAIKQCTAEEKQQYGIVPGAYFIRKQDDGRDCVEYVNSLEVQFNHTAIPIVASNRDAILLAIAEFKKQHLTPVPLTEKLMQALVDLATNRHDPPRSFSSTV